MRNIVQYPIQANEAIEMLERLRDAELASGRIGGMDATLLQSLIWLVDEYPTAFEELANHIARE